MCSFSFERNDRGAAAGDVRWGGLAQQATVRPPGDALADGGDEAGRAVHLAEHPGGGADEADGRVGLPVEVTDGRGHRGDPGDDLAVGDADADAVGLGEQVAVGVRGARRAGPGREGHGQAALRKLRVEGRDDLAGAGAVGREATRHGVHQPPTVGALQALGVDDVGAVQDAQVHGVAGDLAQFLQERQRHLAQLESLLGELTEFEQVQTQPVLPALGVLLHQPAGAQRGQQPVRGALGDAQPPRDVGDPELGIEGEAVQHIQGAADRSESVARRRVPMDHPGSSSGLTVVDLPLDTRRWRAENQHMCAAERNAAPSVISRVSAILDALHEARDALTLSELARATDMPKSTVHRLTEELCAGTYLERTDGGYRLGLRLFELGSGAPPQRDLRDAAAPYMADLREATHCTVHLAVLDGVDVVYVQILASKGAQRLPSRIGRRLPAHATGVGKAILAFSPQETVMARLEAGLPRRTPRTITAPGAFMNELKAIRASGLSYDREESSLGVHCVAVPIIPADGHVAAAMSVTAGSARTISRLGPATQAVGLALGRRLSDGYVTPAGVRRPAQP